MLGTFALGHDRARHIAIDGKTLKGIVHAVRHDLAKFLAGDVVHVDGAGIALGPVIAAAVFAIADQFLLLGFDGDRRRYAYAVRVVVLANLPRNRFTCCCESPNLAVRALAAVPRTSSSNDAFCVTI